jgi:hypothetical protein
MDWMAEERFDWTGPRYGNATAMGRYLGSHRDDARFRVAAIEHARSSTAVTGEGRTGMKASPSHCFGAVPIWPTT